MFNKENKKHKGFKRWFIVTLTLSSAVFLAACGDNSDRSSGSDAGEKISIEDIYTPTDFSNDLHFTTEVSNKAYDDFQTLLKNYQFVGFTEDADEGTTHINEVLNTFDINKNAEYSSIEGIEEYVFIPYESEKSLGVEGEKSGVRETAFLSTFYIYKGLTAAGIFDNQVDFNIEEALTAEEVSLVFSEGANLKTLAEYQPLVSGVAYLKTDEDDFYIYSIPGVTLNGTLIYYLPIYNQKGQLLVSDMISQENKSTSATNDFNLMLNKMTDYYQEEELEAEEVINPVKGRLMDLTKLNEGIDQIVIQSQENEVNQAQVQDILGEPSQTSEYEDHYRAQYKNGNVLQVAIIYNEGKIEGLQKDIQSNSADYKFGEKAIEAVSQMPNTTDIAEVIELYGQPQTQYFSVSNSQWAYIWMNPNQDEGVSLVEIIVEMDGSIVSLAYE